MPLVNFYPAAANMNGNNIRFGRATMDVQTWPRWRQVFEEEKNENWSYRIDSHGGVTAFATQSSAAPIAPLGEDDGQNVLVAARPVGPAAPRLSLVIAAQSMPAGVFHPAGMLFYEIRLFAPRAER
jgi:hypothetical protein